jgi:hypothetical protein
VKFAHAELGLCFVRGTNTRLGPEAGGAAAGSGAGLSAAACAQGLLCGQKLLAIDGGTLDQHIGHAELLETLRLVRRRVLP